MLDLSHIPTSTRCDVQVFNQPSTVTNLQWLQWKRPRGTSMLFAYVVGGGAGGGGGLTAAAASARGGGGGGGSSATTRILVPSILLPETLYLQVGAGGVGGGSTVAGSSGILSYIAVAPNTTASNCLAVSGAAAPTGGGAGTAAAAGTAGVAGTIAVIGSMPLAGLGMYFMIAGQVGIVGGLHTGQNGANTTIPVTGVLTQGGAGGGGVTAADFAGGGVTAITSSLLSEVRPATGAAGPVPGSSGPVLPWFSFGGLGAGSDNAAGTPGCNGGNGGPGAGGGGGGGNPTGSTGKGGDGGNGMIVMVSW